MFISDYVQVGREGSSGVETAKRTFEAIKQFMTLREAFKNTEMDLTH